ncbi:MAG: EamA family transporter [Nitrososphaerales archaeon]
MLALGSSICFAGNRAFASRPLVKSDPQIPTFVSLIVGVIITGVATISFFQGISIFYLTVITFAIFGTVGIMHFAIGRQLSYIAEKNIGANQAAPLISTQIIYSVLFAIILLGETVNFEIVAGAAMILAGGFLLEAKSSAAKRGGNLRKGYIAAILTSVLFGFSPLLIKAGLASYDYFTAATFVAYATALIFYTLTRNAGRIIGQAVSLPRYALVFYLISGSLAAMGQLFRFSALSFAPVVIVIPILAAHPIFTVMMTRGLARDYEVFHARTISAIIIVVIGTIIVALSSSIAL